MPGPLEAGPKQGELQTRQMCVQPDSVERGFGKGEGGEAGDHVISHDQAVPPVPVAVPPYQGVIEDRSKNIDVLEEGTAVLLVETTVFGPGKEFVTANEVIAHGTEISPRMVRVRRGVVGGS